MSLILSGTDGLSDVDGSAATPAIRGTDANTGIFFPAADTIAFAEGGAEVARFDSAGNLGIGVTPTSYATVKAIQLNTASTLMAFTNEFDIGQNVYYNAGNKYITTGAATMYAQTTGQHQWFNAASGTAGNAITFTQAMTLDASGNLLVGSTSADAKLHVNATSGTLLKVNNPNVAQLNIGNGGNSTNYYDADTQIFRSGGGSERARIDSSGNLLVGATSNPAGVRLVIGGTSSSARVEPATDNVGYIGEGTYRWQAVYAVNGTIQTSDGREKNTIEDSNLGLSFVNALRPVSYKWNVGENVVTYDEEGKEVVTPRAGVRVHYGFIAQEVKAVIPKGVDFGGFVQEPDEGRMSLRYHEFIGPLVKAIQEQQALITQLTARITALESA
jgi:hypothetical protein